jgi:hypothetical protein
MRIFDDRFIELNQCDARKAACTESLDDGG